MNGLNETKNISHQAVVDKAVELKNKALAARAQNHPRTEALEAEYDQFKTTNADVLKPYAV